ncbi:hypothetical protein [Halioxenophilus aromaticivorans]|uniref:Sulfotransferase family protein n=1 Tax=Halioxenophilus aromaticivorans TaxID=1306992 RepID=A0AAV3TYZ1_9ALTE
MAGNTLAVIGMHRSGTSLVAQWLSRSGLDMGENLLGPGAGNEQGHYEDTEFVSAHSQVMSLWGLDAAGVEPFGSVRKVVEDQARILKELDSRFSQEYDWGWKDPRTCLFLDYYGSVRSDINYLVVFRRPEAVVNSLLRRKFEMKRCQRSSYNSISLLGEIGGFVSSVKFRRKYWAAWNDYNESILRFLASRKGDSNIFVTSLSALPSRKDSLGVWLSANGFNLELLEFTSVFDESLLADEYSVGLGVPKSERLRAKEIWGGLIDIERIFSG